MKMSEFEDKVESDEMDRREAADVENCAYIIKSNPENEFEFLLSFYHKDGWIWKKHPDNPFKIKDIMIWAEAYKELRKLAPEIIERVENSFDWQINESPNPDTEGAVADECNTLIGRIKKALSIEHDENLEVKLGFR